MRLFAVLLYFMCVTAFAGGSDSTSFGASAGESFGVVVTPVVRGNVQPSIQCDSTCLGGASTSFGISGASLGQVDSNKQVGRITRDSQIKDCDSTCLAGTAMATATISGNICHGADLYVQFSNGYESISVANSSDCRRVGYVTVVIDDIAQCTGSRVNVQERMTAVVPYEVLGGVAKWGPFNYDAYQSVYQWPDNGSRMNGQWGFGLRSYSGGVGTLGTAGNIYIQAARVIGFSVSGLPPEVLPPLNVVSFDGCGS